MLEGVDVAVRHGRIAMFGDVAHTRGPATEEIDARGAYLVPGLVDTHLDVESVMLTVTRFAEAVPPARDHLRLHPQPRDGERLRPRRDALDARGGPGPAPRGVPRRTVGVPALSGFEDSGAVLGPEEIATALDWPGAAGLGEMMNTPGVLAGDESVHAVLAATIRRGKPLTGHLSLTGWRDQRLQAYAAAGVDSCHETTAREDALAKLRAGMWVQSVRARRSRTSPRSCPF